MAENKNKQPINKPISPKPTKPKKERVFDNGGKVTTTSVIPPKKT